MLYVAPRSTWMNCGSTPAALAQRVPALPSTASAQGNCGVGEQVAGLFRARLVVWAAGFAMADCGWKPRFIAAAMNSRITKACAKNLVDVFLLFLSPYNNRRLQPAQARRQSCILLHFH